MELAQGEDLSPRIARGALPVDDAIAIAMQIAEALEAAHEKGVVHRDLKPANVKVGDEGQVKVLDFGLAKALETEGGDGDLSNSPTLARAATDAGMILGTAAYMSPEQARGRKVDKRADIWAFGVVLWEMLTGRRLFAGDTVSDTLASVLKEEPEWDRLPKGVPPAIHRVLRRCLVKDPNKRLRDIGDVLVELQDPERETAAMQSLAPAPARKGRLASVAPWLVALAAIALLAGSVLMRKPGAGRFPVRKLTIAPITEQGAAKGPTLSPDGKRVAYLTSDAIWIRDLDHQAPRRIADSKGSMRGTYFWSPESHWLAFVSDDSLWKAPVDGAAPALICRIPAEQRSIAGAWGKSDRIVLAKWRGGLLEVSAMGGAIRELMPAPKELVDYHALSLLPDGETLIASPHLVGETPRTTVDVIRGGKRIKPLILSGDFRGGGVSYAPSGHLVFSRVLLNAGVWAVPFSVKTLSVTGEPFVVEPNATDASVANDGSMAYLFNLDQRPSQLVHVAWDGTIIGTIAAPAEFLQAPLFSPESGFSSRGASRAGDRLTTGSSSSTSAACRPRRSWGPAFPAAFSRTEAACSTRRSASGTTTTWCFSLSRRERSRGRSSSLPTARDPRRSLPTGGSSPMNRTRPETTKCSSPASPAPKGAGRSRRAAGSSRCGAATGGRSTFETRTSSTRWR
jgi:serine/threonine-protein kinase